MAKIIVNNTTNLVVYCLQDSQGITLTAEECMYTNLDGTRTFVLDVNSSTHTVYTDVTAPTSFWGNCFTYIDGKWALDSNRVNDINTGNALVGRNNINPQL
tara:strand:- start:69 stop:371 length:303 start_codon:yes stop_codon:yes gene_type:complete